MCQGNLHEDFFLLHFSFQAAWKYIKMVEQKKKVLSEDL